MHDNEYLYGTDDVPTIPADVIMRRIELLDEQLSDLYEVKYMDRDEKRIRAVRKALDFWERISER